MTVFISYLAPSITSFIQYRKASDHWNESSYEINLKLFDRYCYECNPDTYAELTQETADSWCRLYRPDHIVGKLPACHNRICRIELS